MTETADERRRRLTDEARLLSELLRDRVDVLAPILLPEGRRDGPDWRAGKRGSKSIRLTGPDRGVFRDFEEGGKGRDPLGAVQDLVCNGSLREAVQWAKSFTGHDGIPPERMEQARVAAEARQEREAAKAKEYRAKRGRQARGLWHNAEPIAGSPAESFLRDARGIDIARLPKPPGALRYSGAVWCSERRGEHPAMLAGMWRQGEPQLVCCHRTYLERGPAGWDKAPVGKARSVLGSWPGAVIPLTRGETGRRWRQIEEGELVVLAEGIEEGLSVAIVQPTWRVGAVGFVGNFGQVILPVWCHVLLAINNDAPGSEAHRAIFGGTVRGRTVPGAVRDLEAAGHVVRVARPPAEFKDWNDFLKGGS